MSWNHIHLGQDQRVSYMGEITLFFYPVKIYIFCRKALSFGNAFLLMFSRSREKNESHMKKLR